jgi:hypothetical protein
MTQTPAFSAKRFASQVLPLPLFPMMTVRMGASLMSTVRSAQQKWQCNSSQRGLHTSKYYEFRSILHPIPLV